MNTPPSTPHTENASPSAGKRTVHILIGLAFSALFIWLAARNVDWNTLQDQLGTMRWEYVAAYLGILSVAHLLRVVRWGVLIRVLGDVSWRHATAIGTVGMLAVFALPARLGELVRPAMTSRLERGSVPFSEVVATVVTERLIDGLFMSAILLGTIALLDPNQVPPEYMKSGMVAAGFFASVFVGIPVAILIFPWVEAVIQATLGKISKPIAERILGILRSFLGAFRSLNSPRTLTVYIALTAVVWFLSGLGMWVLFSAFSGSIAALGLTASFALLSVLIVGIMIPAGPGNTGVFHWAIVFGLGMFAIDHSTAFLYATVLHLAVAVINIFWGGVGWFAGGLSFRALRSPQRSEDEGASL